MLWTAAPSVSLLLPAPAISPSALARLPTWLCLPGKLTLADLPCFVLIIVCSVFTVPSVFVSTPHPPLPAPSPTVCPCSFSWGPHCLPASASKASSGLQSCSSLGSTQYSHSSLCSQLSPPAPPRPTPPHLTIDCGQATCLCLGVNTQNCQASVKVAAHNRRLARVAQVQLKAVSEPKHCCAFTTCNGCVWRVQSRYAQSHRFVACRGRLSEGHSIIVPTEHVASTRQVDDHIWTELRNFKKCLLQMHMAQVTNRQCTSILIKCICMNRTLSVGPQWVPRTVEISLNKRKDWQLLNCCLPG